MLERERECRTRIVSSAEWRDNPSICVLLSHPLQPSLPGVTSVANSPSHYSDFYQPSNPDDMTPGHLTISSSHHLTISPYHHLTISPSHHLTISPSHYLTIIIFLWTTWSLRESFSLINLLLNASDHSDNYNPRKIP